MGDSSIGKLLFRLICLVLLSSDIEGALLFTQEPGDKVYVQEGSSAILTWAYTVDNRAAELKRITWTIYNKTLGADVTLILEGKSGNVMYNPNVPPTYGPDRVTKVGQASILIKNVTFKDSADYTCILAGEGSTPNVQDEVALIVTGHPIVLPMVTSVKMGVSATLTCRATGVPGQKITWKRRNGQNELRIINNGKYEIISSGSGSSQLTIKHISISDHGYYVCDTSAIVNQPSSARGFLGVRSIAAVTASYLSDATNRGISFISVIVLFMMVLYLQ